MSVGKVSANINHALQNRSISTAEAEQITSKVDGWLSSPESVGTFVDKDEFQAISDLHKKVVKGEVSATPEAKSILKSFVDKGADSRLSHAAKGGALGLSTSSVIEGIAKENGGPQALLTMGSVAMLVASGPVLMGQASVLALGIAAGYSAGFMQGMLDD